MPIDKFGRHQNHPKRLLTNSSFVEHVAKRLSSVWVLQIRGTVSQGSLYRLENGTYEYVFPVSGVVEDMRGSEGVHVWHKGNEILRLGDTVLKGEGVKFIARSGSSTPLYMELIIRSPLTDNDNVKASNRF